MTLHKKKCVIAFTTLLLISENLFPTTSMLSCRQFCLKYDQHYMWTPLARIWIVVRHVIGDKSLSLDPTWYEKIYSNYTNQGIMRVCVELRSKHFHITTNSKLHLLAYAVALSWDVRWECRVPTHSILSKYTILGLSGFDWYQFSCTVFHIFYLVLRERNYVKWKCFLLYIILFRIWISSGKKSHIYRI